MSVCCHRLHRVTQIQQVLVQQIAVLETMTPMDFLDFRDYLIPASGFQSAQFRFIEMTLGIPMQGRRYGTESFLMGVFNDKDKERVERYSKRESLNSLIEQWLERMPFYKSEDYDFWTDYRNAVDRMISKDEELVFAMIQDPEQR